MASTSSSKSLSASDANFPIIDKFCMVTGSTPDKARKMLEICNWNLEMAVNMHVDGDFQETPCIEPVVDEEMVRSPIPQSRGILVEEDASFQYGIRGRKRRLHTVFDGFRDFQAEAEIQEQSSVHENNESSKKRRTLEDLFRPPLDLIHRGNFESARDLGQVSNRWLMVNLQNSQEFSCQVLNRDVWSNQNVKNLVAQHFVFWQVYNDSADGERYMQFYKATEFPYIAILDPRTGEKLVEWHSVDSKSIVQLINVFLSEHKSLDGSKPAVFNEMIFSLLDQSEEEQIKAALEASLVETKLVTVDDNDSELETFDSDTESVPEKDANINNSNANSDHSNDIIDVVNVTESSNMLTEEKTWRDFLGGEEDPKLDLVLRLPDGKREQITWPCTTKVESLILYIREIGYDPEKYELVTNYPRRNLCQIDVQKSLKEVDLYPREMIIVQLKS